MTDAERTMREEQWMLTQEFLDPDRPEPPIVTAFKLLDADGWEAFLRNIDDSHALKFFNPELRDFSCAADWETLASECGIEPYDQWWSIDPQLAPEVCDFCREFRAAVRDREGITAGGLAAFTAPGVGMVKELGLIVYHDGGGLAPYFNPAYQRVADYQLVDQLLRPRKLWREMQDGGTTYIYRT